MDPIFSIRGTVIAGRRVGRSLGYPTANLQYPTDAALPADGVYAAAVRLPDEAIARPAMLNQGSHPTLPDGNHTIEIYLLDYQGDLYGSEIEVDYLQFLRPEKRFTSVDELKRQLQRDEQGVRVWFAER